ncbi:(2Fe-2S)-binding protein [Corallococcus macrosporus DSM 14697]|uniref:(2Fe-2S)-binding protein n=2 Tax=Corallococcus macrosporus TaxID=35 RepID=A0A250JTZ1_9BACT|nr:(2Fe-2S)-binding protein [Corallococcus macrosporus DSM 14697]
MNGQMDGGFIPVATLDVLDAGGRAVVQVDGVAVALFRVGEEILAVADACPHRAGPLSEGDLVGDVVHCPLHTWPFDLRSGLCTRHPGVQVRTYAVRIQGAHILVSASGRVPTP